MAPSTVSLYLYSPDWSVIPQALPSLLRGLVYSLEIAFATLGGAFALGLAVALCRVSKIGPLKAVAYAYVQVFRALSLYVYILWIYFGLGIALGINLTPLQAGVVALTFLFSAYTAEIFRAAIVAVDTGQREAAVALGLNPISVFAFVAFPQAMRIALPALVNSLVDIVKDSAIVAIIGAGDLMYTTIQLAGYYLRAFEFYTVAGMLYLAVILILTRVASGLERRFPVRAA
jgi:His/Glu/Gln/Arg/opine family amino acid ABC transporter permease subunit